jgi:hypothetical protein
MFKFEYVNRILGPLVTPAAKLNRVKTDIQDLLVRPSRSIAEAEFLEVLKTIETDLVAKFSEADLAWTEENQKDAYIKSLAKRSAVLLTSQGRVDVDTMMEISSLAPSDLLLCVRYSTIFATTINNSTKDAEQTVTPQDIVTIDSF